MYRTTFGIDSRRHWPNRLANSRACRPALWHCPNSKGRSQSRISNPDLGWLGRLDAEDRMVTFWCSGPVYLIISIINNFHKKNIKYFLKRQLNVWAHCRWGLYSPLVLSLVTAPLLCRRRPPHSDHNSVLRTSKSNLCHFTNPRWRSLPLRGYKEAQ
jgi:hypothetical protein